jgi:hypothetical protein
MVAAGPASDDTSSAVLTPESAGAAGDIEMRELNPRGSRSGSGAGGGEEYEEWDDKAPSVRRGRRRGAGKPRYTPDEEGAVVRKLDRKLVLFVALLYMLSFLDRSSESRLRLVTKSPVAIRDSADC